MQKNRYTPTTLMRAIHDQLVADGCYGEAGPIMDYFLPSSNFERRQFTNYEFDTIAYPCFGSSEGIYLSVVAQGHMDAAGQMDRWKIGTYKTLRTDLEAMQIMGKLAGSIVYHAYQFVNAHLDDFEPDKRQDSNFHH